MDEHEDYFRRWAEKFVEDARAEIATMSRAVFMCGCPDYLTCEHPYPKMMETRSLSELVDEMERHMAAYEK